jgi:glycerophosphoryl diester phosphodiesterase
MKVNPMRFPGFMPNASRPLILAHRGASAQAPENTLPAFELAIRQQADGIELDVHLSADGVVVVTHDEDCLRVTGESGKIGELTLAQLKMRNFAWFRPEAGFCPMPTLEEVLDLIDPTRLMINIELKNSVIDYPGLLEEVIRLVTQHRMQERILLSSFNHDSIADACRLVRERSLPIRCGLLFSHRLARPWDKARQIGADAIHPHHVLARRPDYIEKAHMAGIAVNIWTLNDEEELERFMRMGADAVITNVPDLAAVVRSRIVAEADPG